MVKEEGETRVKGKKEEEEREEKETEVWSHLVIWKTVADVGKCINVLRPRTARFSYLDLMYSIW